MPILLFVCFVIAIGQHDQIHEPYPPLHGYDPVGTATNKNSPDPLVSYTWSNVNESAMQRYSITKAFKAQAQPESAFTGVSSLVDAKASTHVTVCGSGSLQLDFGVERAAWFAFTSPDMPNGATMCHLTTL